MNIEIYSIGRCPICGQGDIIIVKSKSNDQFMLICDDCESQWEDPNVLFAGGAPLMNEKYDLVDVTDEEEVNASGWKKYIKNILNLIKNC